MTLRDRAGHRLKDLNLPEHLYQLFIPGTPVGAVSTAEVGRSDLEPAR